MLMRTYIPAPNFIYMNLMNTYYACLTQCYHSINIVKSIHCLPHFLFKYSKLANAI